LWRESNKEYQKKYHLDNKEAVNKKHRHHYHNNKEKYKKYYLDNKKEIVERKKQHYIDNRERLVLSNRQWRAENREYINRYQRHKRKTDPIYRLSLSVSNLVRKALKSQNAVKGGRTFDHLPYTPQQLKEHIESQFEDWMTWDNWGEWHIDHIYPQSKLIYDSLEHPNFQKCWDLSNLQPLRAEDNIRKGDSILL
tara:strand:+ start:2036 stop:2620 length:585 start_codon:yes stop_codon:yes gene_type:complete